MEGAAKTLASTVGQLVGEEFRQLRGVGGEVAQLRDELATASAILRMQSEADDGAMDHFVREWMKQVRELAYDSEDCIDLYMLRIRCRLSNGVLVRAKHLLATLFPRHRLAGDVKALRTRAVAISERHARYGVNREALRRSPTLAPLPAASASTDAFRPANDPDQFVGIRDQANTLAERVNAVSDREGDMKLKVFSIVGFGGLGKTTLAMEVCRQLEAEFQRQAQVSVSQAFDGRNDLEKLLKRVLQQIVMVKAKDENGIMEEDSLPRMDGMDVDELTNTLKELLKDKRYLIVIDDVWTTAAWDAIRCRLPENDCGSRIMVTTRIETVAKACTYADAVGYYRIKPLSPEDSKKLFLSRAFGSMDASCPGELKVAMDNVLKKCGGLPLAIVSIASLLASYKSSESKVMWETVCKSIGSQMESNPTLEGMRQVLTLSYNHLPHHLKGCMMYLSIFPEDYVINKDRLLNRWIAEGFIAEKRGLTLMEVAESYFDELISRSMIDRAADIITHHGGIKTCRVHDTMLEVMVSKSLEANFVSLVGGQYEGMSYGYDRIRRLSIHGLEQEPTDSPSKKMAARRDRRNGIEGMNVQHVRSLSLFKLEGHKLLDRLGEFTLLRVLDLEDCKGVKNKHMGDICRMYLLRFLSLNGTDISEMPPKVGELEHLQTLDVRYTYLEDLPKTVTKLEKLEDLQFSNRSNGDIRWMPPPGLRKMKALRRVSKVVIRSDSQVAQEIGELEQLQELGIHIDSHEPLDQDVLEKFAQSLSKIYSLRWLSTGDLGYGHNSMNFLHGLPSPPRLLRYLRISGGLVGVGLPDWVGSLTYLVEFAIAFAYLVDDQLFGVLCKLPNLKIIDVQTGAYVNEELVARTTHNFPVLRELRVASYKQYVRVFRFELGSATKLEMLAVAFNNMEKSIVGIKHLTNLKEVQLIGGKDNSALKRTLKQLKDVNERRLKSNQFKVVVRYT